MQKLIIIRHGAFDEGETTLNTEGKKQMERLARVLTKFDPVVYSSVGPRAIESAAILATCLEKESHAFEFFGSNTRADEKKFYPQALTFIKDIPANVVIVTKGEWANGFIPYLYSKMFDIQFAGTSLERGEGVLINMENGGFTELP